MKEASFEKDKKDLYLFLFFSFHCRQNARHRWFSLTVLGPSQGPSDQSVKKPARRWTWNVWVEMYSCVVKYSAHVGILSQSEAWLVECIAVLRCRPALSASQAACVLKTWWQMAKEAALRGSNVPATTTAIPIKVDRPSVSAATTGEPCNPFTYDDLSRGWIVRLDMVLFVHNTALVDKETGTAQIVSVTGPALCTERGITSRLMRRNSPLTGTVATFLHRYTHSVVFFGGREAVDLWWPWDWHLHFVGLLWKQQGWHLQGRDWEHPVRNNRKHLLHLHQALLRGRQNNHTSAFNCCRHQNNKLTCVLLLSGQKNSSLGWQY